jgi:phosphopantothenoylcysteine synthetase/decarboxylase
MAEQSTSPAPPVVVLGVTGSIAAYKAADLTSKLMQANVEVRVMMTESATKLVQPQTFLTLSRQPVITGLWDLPSWQPEHIALAERAALLVIAPATANILGKMANGIADDALSTFALSHTGPVLVAPAMNPRMWQHPAVRANCALLKERGVIVVEPGTGRVACGEEGTGRLAPVEDILASILQILGL